MKRYPGQGFRTDAQADAAYKTARTRLGAGYCECRMANGEFGRDGLFQSAIRKKFTRRGGQSAIQLGFTLTELIVSVAVLGLMMTLAGAVFHMTLKSTGEAKALTAVTQRLRDLQGTVREDLRGVDPGRSILVIVPASINAYWTEAGREADEDQDTQEYPHPEDLEREVLGPGGEHVLERPRADRVMFVTARRGTSFVDPQLSGSLQLVVYGHGIVGEWEDQDPQPDDYDWQWRKQFGERDAGERKARFDRAMLVGDPPAPQTVFPTSAQQLHFARRSVLLSEYDISYPPGSAAVAVDLDDALAASTDQYALVEGRQDVVASPLILGSRNTAFDLIQGLRHVPDATATMPPESRIEDHPSWYARSELDLTPPAALANLLGHSFLAHCASFKVEFALDLPELRGLGEMLWIDPADLVQNWTKGTDWYDPPTCPTDERLKRLYRRVQSPPDGEELLGPIVADPPSPARKALDALDTLRNVVLNPMGDRFGLADVNGDGNLDEPLARWYSRPPPVGGVSKPGADPYFPTALRITLDVYDDEARFQRPIRQVMVFEIGR